MHVENHNMEAVDLYPGNLNLYKSKPKNREHRFFACDVPVACIHPVIFSDGCDMSSRQTKVHKTHRPKALVVNKKSDDLIEWAC